MILLLLAAQATPVAPPAQPERFSVLYDPCRPARPGSDVVVCADNVPPIPYPPEASRNYIKPDSGDYRDNDAGGTPCAATQWGCASMVGGSLLTAGATTARLVGDALKDRREAHARARDGDRRVAIPLDAPAPAGHLEP